MIKIISRKKIWFTISGALVLMSIGFLFVWGLNFGIDFVGGSVLNVEFEKSIPPVVEINEALKDIGLKSLIVQPTNGKEVILRFQNIEENTHIKVLTSLNNINTEKYGKVNELQFNAVGPSVGNTLKKKSFNAVVLVILAIIFYIAFAFRKVSKPIASWKYGITAVIALFHDCLIVLGVFSVLGHYYGVEINATFIAAILTVLGYSVNDTIVVFDRIRENLPKSEDDFAGTINTSINQTISRSINTSLTTILALVAILFWGGSSIHSFVLALTLGVFVGTYSSIFLASPILILWKEG